MLVRSSFLALAAAFVLCSGAAHAAPDAAPTAAAPKAATEAKADTGAKKSIRRMKEDTDGNGFISQEEYLAPYLTAFHEADTDHDGKLSFDERQAARQKAAERRAEMISKAVSDAQTQNATAPAQEDKKSIFQRFFK